MPFVGGTSRVSLRNRDKVGTRKEAVLPHVCIRQESSPENKGSLQFYQDINASQAVQVTEGLCPCYLRKWFFSQCGSEMWVIQSRQVHSDHIAQTIDLCILVQSNRTSHSLTDPYWLILSPASTHPSLMDEAPKCPNQSFRKKWRKQYFFQACYC